MAFLQNCCTFLLVVLAAVFIQEHQARDLIGRCRCNDKISFVKGNITDFTIWEKHPGCDSVELHVTMQNRTEPICIKTEGKLGQAFLRCWERINKDESRKQECINKWAASFARGKVNRHKSSGGEN